MRHVTRSCAAVAFMGFAPLAVLAAPAPAAHLALPCARTTIAAVKLPAGPAQYQSGSLALANGASLRLQGSRAEISMAKELGVGDPVAACYGPLRIYADAGPSRSITVLDLVNGAYYAALVGTWKPR
jgi:hypothetical protein